MTSRGLPGCSRWAALLTGPICHTGCCKHTQRWGRPMGGLRTEPLYEPFPTHAFIIFFLMWLTLLMTTAFYFPRVPLLKVLHSPTAGRLPITPAPSHLLYGLFSAILVWLAGTVQITVITNDQRLTCLGHNHCPFAT